MKRRHSPPISAIVGVLLAAWMLHPTSAFAGTSSESPPPPCAFTIPTAVAGTLIEISGPLATGASVDVTAEGPDKRVREAAVTTTDRAWHGVLVFDLPEAGSWMARLSIDGGTVCATRFGVLLPAGVVQPPADAAGVVQPPADAAGVVQPPAGAAPGFALADLAGLAAEVAAMVVLASWIFLAVVGVAKLVGARPLSRRWPRALAIPATFVAIVGAFLAVALIVDIGVSFGHFDTGTPPDQQALLDVGIWAMAAAGSLLGGLAALWVRNRTGQDARNARLQRSRP
jgi:hypothetical protein